MSELQDLFLLRCTCCGAELPKKHLFYFSSRNNVLIVKDQAVRFTPTETIIFSELLRHQVGYTANEIVKLLPTPSTDDKTIKVLASRLKAKLEPLGLTLLGQRVTNPNPRHDQERLCKVLRYSLHALPSQTSESRSLEWSASP